MVERAGAWPPAPASWPRSAAAAARWSTSSPGGAWQDLRGEGRTVVGIDIEPIGAENPVIDEFRLIGEDGRWPLDDGSVDLAVSDFVLEHVTDPQAFVARARPRRCGPAASSSPAPSAATPSSPPPPAWCPTTPTPVSLERLQPGREERDVFRTAYKMNTRK